MRKQPPDRKCYPKFEDIIADLYLSAHLDVPALFAVSAKRANLVDKTKDCTAHAHRAW